MQELKQKIALQQATNARRERAKKALVEKHKQSRSSQRLVDTYKRSVETIRAQKEAAR